MARFFQDDPPGFYKVPYGYNDADEIRELVTSAGFSQVIVERSALKSEIVSARDFAKGLVFGNPLYEEVTARGGDPAEVCQALEETIQRDMGNELLLKILMVQATKN